MASVCKRTARWSVCAVSLLAFGTLWCGRAAAQERLIDREPFDRILLDRANESRTLDILPGTFPDRKLPSPLPRTGTLRVRLIERPLDEFDVRWANVVEIRLFEDLVLEETRQLARDRRFREAQEYIAYLKRYYASLPGLDQATESVLEFEVADAYQRGNYERAWMVLTALFDRNPQHAGVAQALGNVSDRLLERDVNAGEFGKARRFLEILRRRFGEAGGRVADRWGERLRGVAGAKLAEAQKHFAEDRLDEARLAVRAALAVQPDLPAAQELAGRIASIRPRVVVGVVAEAPQRLTRRLDDWPSRRIESLVSPPLVELRDFGADGGEYGSAYGELLQDATGLATSLSFPPAAGNESLTPHAVARRILLLGQADAGGLGEALLNQLAGVAVEGGRTLRLQWLHAHVRPEALLRIGVAADARLSEANAQDEAAPHGMYGPFRLKSRTPQEVAFARTDVAESSTRADSAPAEIVERLFASEEDAVDALVRGDVDVVERIAPSHVERLSGRRGVAVDRYALPTVHVLVASARSTPLRLAELRRAIVYAIDREGIARQLFAGDGAAASAVPISGPFPPGSDYADPVGYAYNRAIEPRPFDPRLAATLASVAARLHQASGETEDEGEPGESGLPELVLAHPREPEPRAACQMIAEQLQAVGIAVRLTECDAAEIEDGKCEFDLRYAELAMWEPVVDGPRLLGPRGELGGCSARMGLALAEVDQARTWQGVRDGLHEVHRVAYDELQVIPLWQTTNYFAYRDSLAGIGPEPVSLYQNVGAWELRRGGGSSR